MEFVLPQPTDAPDPSQDLIKTGIPELNVLLGGGIRPGSIVLIRGGPGVGKTTLAAQIIAKVTKPGHTACAYIGLEEGATSALVRLDRPYSELGLGVQLTAGWIATIEAAQFAQDIATATPGHPSKLLEQIRTQILARIGSYIGYDGDIRIAFIVVDSLTACVQALMRHGGAYYTERVAMQKICRYFHDMQFGLGNTSLLLIAEQNAATDGSAVESYVADCVIDLSVRSILRRPKSTNLEHLRFCTVKKARNQPNQSRACCYDFSPPVGLQFYPTYAAEGLVSLFWENEPQKDSFDNFKDEDIAMLYPLLEVEEFTRSALQRTFAIRRHETEIPVRKPMCLLNLDEYWVMAMSKTPGHNLLRPIEQAEIAIYSAHKGDFTFLDELVAGKEFLHPEGITNRWMGIPFVGNIGMFVYRKDILNGLSPNELTTWEQIEHAYASKQIPSEKKFLIETRTYDSLMVFMFEWLWSHGAQLQIHQGRIDLGVGSFEQVVQAMCRLNDWIFKLDIIPHFSSVEPSYCANGNWALSRHWYSTLVELLCCRDRKTRQIVARKLNGHDLAPNIGVCRIPVSDWYRDVQRKQGCAESAIVHHSAWGEWYLAMERGTENVELGNDLISNLMTPGRIVERAFSGAGLPTVKAFYDGPYGSSKCPWTDLTFRNLRETLFKNAISRTMIDNYEVDGLKLYGACSAIVSVPMKCDEIRTLVLEAFHAIDPKFMSGVEGK